MWFGRAIFPTSAKLFLERAGLPIRDVCASTAEFDERDLVILGDLEGFVKARRQRINSPLK